jgi:WD40 repeat protein
MPAQGRQVGCPSHRLLPRPNTDKLTRENRPIMQTRMNTWLRACLRSRSSCFDRLSTNEKSSTNSIPNPFALSLSKGERRVFQHPLTHMTLVALSMMVVLNTHLQTWAQESDREANTKSTTNQPRLVVQLGHAGEVASAIALSPDGRFLLTGGIDKTACLWEMATGREVQRFEGHEDRISAVAFLPDGQFVVTISQDTTVRLWEKRTGREVQRFVVRQPALHQVVFSPDARFIAAGAGKTVHVWEVATGQEIQRFALRTGTLGVLAFSPDGQFLLVGESYLLTNRSAAAHLWNTTTGQEIQRFAGHIRSVIAAAFSPDGRFVLTKGVEATVHVWEVATGREVQRLTLQTGAIAAFSFDSKFVLTLGQEGHSEKPGVLNNLTVSFWDIVTGQEVQRLTGYTAKIDANDISANFLSNGRFIVIRGMFDWNPTLLLDTATGQEVSRLESLASEVSSVDFSPDGRLMLTGSRNGTVHLWDTVSGQGVRRFDVPGNLFSTAFTTDGRLVVTKSSGAGERTRLWEVETGSEVRNAFPQLTAVLSPDGRFVLTRDGGTATLHDAETGQALRQFRHGAMHFMALAFSPDGRFVLTSGDNNLARLWDIAAGAEVRSFTGHTGTIATIAFGYEVRFL